MPPHTAAFATSVVLSKRPRIPVPLASTFPGECICHCRRPTPAPAPRARGSHPSPRMSSGEPIVRAEPENEGHVGSGGFIPQGAFNISLKVKIRDAVSIADGKAVLAEYARKTCSEPGVLRCDVLYQVTSRGTAKGRFFEIWTVFQDPGAYTAHEKTAHAARLRLWLENPVGGDCAVLLTKLSYEARIFESLRPAAEAWKSSIDYSVESEDERNQRMADAAIDLIRGNAPTVSDNMRKSLDVLVSNVGLENVTVLVASATAKSDHEAASLMGICEEYVEDLEKGVSIVRTGILVERKDPRKIVVMTVHDSNREDGAFFDTDMAADLIDDDGWSVKRCFPVFPDKVGWEKPSTLLDQEEEPTQDDVLNFLGPVDQAPDGLVSSRSLATIPSAPASNCRLLQGAGAFDRLKDVIREITGKDTGEVKSMILCGWNASRVQPLLVQLQLVKGKDPGLISFKFGLSVEDCDVSTDRLKKGIAFIKEHEPDVLLGYGGGAVMDMTKALGLVGNASFDEVDKYVQQIHAAADASSGKVRLDISSRPIPVVLMPTTIGAGAELTELCVFKARRRSDMPRRVCVNFMSASGVEGHPNDRVILCDSRLVGPRILYGKNAAQGALMLVCRGIEVLLGINDHKGHQAAEQAEQGIAGSFRLVMDAYREPRKGSGQSRDPLTYAQTKIGLAADCMGRMGLCTRLSLAAVDEIIDELYPHCFRTIFIRVTAALLTNIGALGEEEACRQFSDHVAKAMLVGDSREGVKQLLRRAEDVNVPLVSRMGFLRRTAASAAKHVVEGMVQEEGLSSLERRLADEGLLEQVLLDAINQDYEL